MQAIISSRSNPLVRQIRAQRQTKQRRTSGLFLVEGIHHVGAVIEAGWQVELVAYAPERLTSAYALDLLAGLPRRGVQLAALSAELFAELTDRQNPAGILALVRQRSLALEDLDRDRLRCGVACVAPQDPGNVGTILRTMDAAGAQALLLLDGGADPYQPACVRASMGTLFHLPVVQSTFPEFLGWLRRRDCLLIGSSAHAPLDYRSAALPDRPFFLLLGSEQKGLTPEQLAACDRVVSLPMRGRASSLNLAVAAGILLYTLLEGCTS
jgi:TrmH family RNA methyltransferase